MEPIHYFIIYCIGFVLSMAFYWWLNRQPIDPNELDSWGQPGTPISVGFAVTMSIFWPFILACYLFDILFTVMAMPFSTQLWQRFTDWYEGK